MSFLFKRSLSVINKVITISGWLAKLKGKLEKNDQWTTLLSKLDGCQTNLDRVQTVAQLDVIDSIVDVEAEPNTKSEEDAVKYREAGNVLFQKKEFVKALKQYNRSVMLAPTTSDTATLALAFANRYYCF